MKKLYDFILTFRARKVRGSIKLRQVKSTKLRKNRPVSLQNMISNKTPFCAVFQQPIPVGLVYL
jgi:hypothetical protein